MQAPPSLVTDPRRLDALHRLALIDDSQELSFDRLTNLASRLLHVPIVVISLVGADRQYYKSSVGLSRLGITEHDLPLSYSLCQYVVALNGPLIIADAREHPLVCETLAVTHLNVVAYAGLPLVTADGFVLGAFAAVDDKPRDWSDEDVELLAEFARSVMIDIKLRLEHHMLASEVRHHSAERLRVERALEHAEHRYRSLTEAASDAIVSRSEDGIILTWNAAAERIFGYRADEVIGRSHTMLLPTARRNVTNEQIRSVLGKTVETVGLRKGGVAFPLELSLGGWHDGQQFMYVVVMRDITERKQVENELRARDQFMRTAFYDAAIGMALVGLDGRWLQANAAVSEIVGYSEAELLQLDFQTLTYPDDLETNLELLRQLVAGEIRAYQMEKRYCHKDGHVVWVLLNVSLVRDQDGRPMHCISQIQDITARKQALHDLELARVAAEQGNRAKSQFMATMSHEFRTPLHGIVGMTDLLLETALNEEQHMYATTVRDAAQSLGGILGDILDFVTIESESLELSETEFDPRLMIDQVVKTFSPTCAAKKVRLDTRFEPSVPAMLVGDQKRVQQILLNLVGNAVKFTEQGSISVGMSGYTLSPTHTLVEYVVHDTGIGVPEGVLSHLFEPFSQGDGSWARRYGGVGLGLALTYRLVEKMNGSIAAESGSGKGSVFTVKIPFEHAQVAVAAVVPPAVAAPTLPTPGTILVAEDNMVNQRLVMLQLRKLGYDAEPVSDGLAAVEAVRHRHYALVLMDCQMPGMDGLSATAAIRDMERTLPGARHLPIIALTANAMEGDRELCLRAGMDDYVSKPVKVDVLNGVIKRWMPAATDQ